MSLLTLCMMVKNEAHGIAATLRSAKPYVDRWCILDTGSTDGTQDVVRAELDGIDGALFNEAFGDFATTRNRLLSLASDPGRGPSSEFLLLLDADDILEGGEVLRAFLEDETRRDRDRDSLAANPLLWPSSREALYVPMSEGACEWNSARVVRASAGWRYVGAVHEVLCHPDRPPPSITIPGVRIRHERGPVSAERMRARLARDLDLLDAEVERDPLNARAVYYLAQTYKRMGETEEARRWFGRRVLMGGWKEEVYDSMYEAALIEADPYWLDGLLDAHAFDPRRAEPLYEIARRYLNVAKERREHAGKPWGRQPEDALAFLFARRAWELPKPAGALFVNAEVYAWCAADVLAQAAWWMGEHEIGERAARQAVENGPASEGYLRENLRFYEERGR